MRPLLALAVSIALSSCAMLPESRNAKLEATLNTWTGKHIDDLVSAWGPPSARHKFSDGREVAEWTRTGSAVQKTPSGVVRDVIQYACTTSFMVDPKGFVRWDRYDGC